MYNDYLAHYGVLGMRWGVRRYQNKDGSLTKEGKKRLGIKDSSSPRHTPSKARNQKKAEEAAAKKAKTEEEEREQFEKRKAEALAKGNATAVLKYKGSLTNQELQNAVTRINLEKQLASISAQETKDVWDKVDSIVKKAEKAKNLADKGIEAYNLIAKVHNSFSEEDEKWKTIGGDNTPKTNKKNEKLVKTGTAEQILAASKRGELSGKELEAAVKRLNSEKALSGYTGGGSKQESSKQETDRKEIEKIAKAEISKTESKSPSSNNKSSDSEKSDLQKAVERDPRYKRAVRTLEKARSERISREVDEMMAALSGPTFQLPISQVGNSQFTQTGLELFNLLDPRLFHDDMKK